MALETANYKSIGLLVGLVTIGVIIVTATVALRGRGQESFDAQPVLEEQSGLVVDAPTDWTVGRSANNTVQIRTARLGSIQTQRSTCNSFSNDISNSIQRALESGPNAAEQAWKTEFPGLATISVRSSKGGFSTLVGIDTCSETLTTNSLTVRGQAYKNDIEVRMSYSIPVDDDLSATQVKDIAQALFAGTANPSDQTMFNKFVVFVESAR